MSKESMTYAEWKEATKDACKTREQFIGGDNGITEALAPHEAIWGLLQKAASIPLSGGRFVLLCRFEQNFRVVFHNPENKDGDDTLECHLSFEALAAFNSLAGLMLEESDFEEMQSQAIATITSRKLGGELPHPECQVCEGLEHHWRPNSIDPSDEEAVAEFTARLGTVPTEALLLAHENCAHCPAIRPYQDEEDNEDE